jgi:hypothetical protein
VSQLNASEAPVHAARRGRGGFVLMVAGWVVFFGLLVASEPTLGELWHDVRDLSLVVEVVVWLLLFPFVLGLGVWDSGWDGWLRLLLVCCFAIGWSIAFWPRRKDVP